MLPWSQPAPWPGSATADRSAGEASDRRRSDLGCWGSSLTRDRSLCTPGFSSSGKNHFQTKFCLNCHANGIKMKRDQVRLLLPSAAFSESNVATTRGFWKVALEGRFRIINSTHKCSGPRYLLLEDPNSELARVPFVAPVPDNLIDDDGFVHLVMVYGTLSPIDPRQGRVGRKRRIDGAALQGGVAPSYAHYVENGVVRLGGMPPLHPGVAGGGAAAPERAQAPLSACCKRRLCSSITKGATRPRRAFREATRE